jgi:hypothetical protein
MSILFLVMQFNRPMTEMKKFLVIEAFTVCFELATVFTQQIMEK